jgi:hypothetical protein
VDPQGETVKDTATGFTWQRGDLSMDGSSHTWNESYAYCAGLGLAGGGWAMPTLDQLKTLLTTEAQVGCYINSCAFPQLCSNAIDWTSTLQHNQLGTPNNMDFAWSVSFVDGNVASYNAATGTPSLVRCVR